MSTRIQFVWFVGHSAVGRQTAIDRCLGGEPQLRLLLGLGKAAAVAQVPVAGAQAVRPPPGVDCALLKWQYETRDAVVHTKRAWPQATHVVVHLHRGEAEHLRLFQAKYPELYADRNEAERVFYEQMQQTQQACEAYRGVVDHYVDLAIVLGSYYVI
jgi:hypothetical protein